MVWFRKGLILVHRYLGIVLSALVVMWFVTGIAMIYAGGMPQLTQSARLEHLPPLDLSQIRMSPAEAAEHGNMTRTPGRLVLTTIMGRPAYRFDTGPSSIVFADTGDLLENVGATDAMAIASRFMQLPEGALHHVGVLTEPDQWTIGQSDQMPLHKITVDDAAGTELYVSESLAEVSMRTTRGSRSLAWVSAIPHWFFLVELRRHDSVWRQSILWTAGLGTLLALLGIALAVTQFSPSSPFRFSRIGSYIPYAGLMRWHYITGVIFGVFTLTWAFSGVLSIEPFDWSTGGGSGAGVARVLTGGGLDVSHFPPIDRAAWDESLSGSALKQVEFLRIQGEPYYLVRGVDPKPLLVEANPLRVRREPFSTESLMSRIEQGNPGVPIVESEMIGDYDSYYYSQNRDTPLPVLRVKFDDPDATWMYVDPGMSRVVGRFTRRVRLERWISTGLHTLDFSFWYYNRPLWDIGVIVLCFGGAVSSGIGLFVGFKRLKRGAQRMIRS